MLLGLDNAEAILMSCARHRVAFVLGLVTVVCLLILIGYYWTADAAPGAFKVDLWLLLIPLGFAFVYSASVGRNLRVELAREQLEYTLSGMSKRDYVNYKVGDDRTAKAFAGSATSATLLAASGIMGPFLRGDNR